MKKNKKNKHKRPLDTYLEKYEFGSGMAGAGQIFDVASDALMGLTSSSVSSMMETIMGRNPHPKVFDFSSNQNPVMKNGGKMKWKNGGTFDGPPNAEVEGDEVYELPNGEVGEFEGPDHEQGGIPVNLPPETEIFSKRLKQAGKSMADRKLAREKSISKLEKALQETPHDKILKETLARTKEKNAIEEQGDMMIQESMNALDDANKVGQFMAKYGGKFKQFDKREEPIKADGEEYQGPKALGNMFTSLIGIGSMFANGGKYLPTYQFGSPGFPYSDDESREILESIQGALMGASGQGDLGTLSMPTDEPNFLKPKNFAAEYGESGTGEMYDDTNYKYKTEGEELSEGLMGLQGTKDVRIADPISLDGILGTTDVKPVNETIPSSISQFLDLSGIKGTTDVKDADGGFLDLSGIKGTTDVKPVDEINESGLLTTDQPTDDADATTAQGQGGEDGLGYDFTSGDVMGMLGTKISGVGPMLTTLANRAGDTPNINAYLNYAKDAINTIKSQKGFLGQMKDKTMRDIGLKADTHAKQARNAARSINTLRAMGEVSNAQEQEMVAQAYSTYAGQMMGVLNQLAQTQQMRDRMVMAGEQARDLADRQDRDNFFTQLNKDIVNYGTSTQKIAKDLNVKEADKDFLELLPQISQYGLGMRKGKDGKWEMYHVASDKKATDKEVKSTIKKAKKDKGTQDNLVELPTDSQEDIPFYLMGLGDLGNQ